jgi:hypothetical protein
MTEPNRSRGIGQPVTTWEGLPRWQRLVACGVAFLLAAGIALKTGRSEAWSVLLFAFLAGRLSSTLVELKPSGR